MGELLAQVTGSHNSKRPRPSGCLWCYPARTQAYEIQTSTRRRTARPPVRLLDQVRDRLRVRHYSLRTEQAYRSWIRRFILACGKRHPAQIGQAKVEAGSVAITCPRKSCSVRCKWRDGVPASPSLPPATRCGIRSPPICWRMATTSARCRSYWVTRTWPPRRSIRMSWAAVRLRCAARWMGSAAWLATSEAAMPVIGACRFSSQARRCRCVSRMRRQVPPPVQRCTTQPSNNALSRTAPLSALVASNA